MTSATPAQICDCGTPWYHQRIRGSGALKLRQAASEHVATAKSVAVILITVLGFLLLVAGLNLVADGINGGKHWKVVAGPLLAGLGAVGALIRGMPPKPRDPPGN